MTYRIYMITGPNGKRYIGKTLLPNIQRRWTQHVREALKVNSSYALHRAIRKHGASAFRIVLLTECIDKRESDVCERAMISQYGTWANGPGGYNMTTGGDGGRLGMKPTAAHRAKLSAALKGRAKTPEHAIAAGLGQRGKKKNPASVEKMRKSLTGRRLTPQHIRNVSRAMASRTMTEAHRAKCAANAVFAHDRNRTLWTDQDWRSAALGRLAEARKSSPIYKARAIMAWKAQLTECI